MPKKNSSTVKTAAKKVHRESWGIELSKARGESHGEKNEQVRSIAMGKNLSRCFLPSRSVCHFKKISNEL